MAENYILERTGSGLELARRNVEGKSLVYALGLSAADPENPLRPREREAYIRDFLNPEIAAGRIGDGVRTKFDDRKFRFDAATVDRAGNLVLRLGITHYQECADCRGWTPQQRADMVKKGLAEHGEPYAFFTRGCGIAVTPITADGSIFVGKRKITEEAAGFGGELAAVCGWVDYREKLEDVNFEDVVIKELGEEFGIGESEIERMVFSGVFSALSASDTDFVWLAPTRLTDKETLHRLKHGRKDDEHSDFIKIANFGEVKSLLETGRLPQSPEQYNVLYSLRASLEQVREGEMGS